MKKSSLFIFLSICVCSSFLISGCGSHSEKPENSLTGVDSTGKAEIIRELPSSTDIGDMYRQNGGVNLEDTFDKPAIESKMTEKALANSGAKSISDLEHHLIVSTKDIDLELLYVTSVDAIFSEGGVFTNVSRIANWESDNKDIATVYQGELHAEKTGTANITVEYNGIKKTVHVNVVDHPNWKEEDGSWYYYDAYGKRTTGWKIINGDWYYLGTSGAMITGWQKIKDAEYYFHSTGKMANGEWVQGKEDGKWYYLNNNGKMSSHKWVTYDNDTYYVHSNGQMATDEWIQQTDGNWYYLLLDGTAAKNRSLDIKGISYQFDKNGKCTNPDGN